mgnify:CR=1 FL=1
MTVHPDVDAVAALTKAGGTFVSTGGKPLDLPTANATLKVGIVRDPDGLFLVLIQSPPPAMSTRLAPPKAKIGTCASISE